MLSVRSGTVNDMPLGFEPVLSYRKTHSFSTLIGEEDATFKMNKMIEKGKELCLKKKGGKENSMYKSLLPVKIITDP